MTEIQHVTPYWGLNIDAIEGHYKARYVAEVALKQPSGRYSDFPLAIFYQERPPLNYSHYAAFYVKNGQLLITSGEAFEPWVTAVFCHDGEIIYSSYRHDYVKSKSGGDFIDGGYDYLRCNIDARVVKYNIETEQMRTLDEHDQIEHQHSGIRQSDGVAGQEREERDGSA